MSDNKKIRKSVEDLGVAAYLRMHGYKVIGRKGKFVLFEINEVDEAEFNKCSFDYINSPFAEFDNHLMVIKKVREYMPD